jgi:hypothetical protein
VTYGASLIVQEGDIMALSHADFATLKSIVDKGRGKDVTPSA